MDEFSTHQPVLKKALEVFNPSRILEHGCGDYSTPILAKDRELSFTEHDSHWADHIMRDYNLTHVKYYPKNDLIGLSTKNVELAFIDGMRTGRTPSINYCLTNNIPVILVHDFQLPYHYNYNSISLLPGYRLARFACLDSIDLRQTAVIWNTDENVLNWKVDCHKVV